MVNQRRSSGSVLSVTGVVTLAFGAVILALSWFNVISASCFFVSAFQVVFSAGFLVIGGLVLILGLVLRKTSKR